MSREEKLAKKRAYAKANPQSGEYRAAFYQKHRDVILANVKAYAERNKEKIADYQQKYASRTRESRLRYLKAYYRANRESAQEAYREAYRAHPEKFAKRSRARNASISLASVMWDMDLDRLVFSEAKRLRKMRESATGIKWEIDHIVPIRSRLVCGVHAFTNIAVVPRCVNRSKSNFAWPHMPEAI